MSRLAVLVLALLILPRLLSAQEAAGASGETSPEADEGAGPGLFSVALLVHAAYAGNSPWRPDWSPALPPDGFVLSSGDFRSLTLTLDSESYTLRRNGGGFFEEFPLLLDGTLRRVQADFEPSGAIRELRINDEIPWRIEVLEYAENPCFPAPAPARVRVLREERVYFVLLVYTTRGFSETWFDAEEAGLVFWEADFIPLPGGNRLKRLERADRTGAVLGNLDYDSGGNLVEIRGPGGTYSVLYDRRGLPRYWERRPAPEVFESYTLQWDEGGFLVRVSGAAGPGAEDLVDLRYEYSLDERGNWTERRETRMFPYFGVLFPGPGLTVKRTIHYNTE
jgi:hypothetical protein